MPVGTNEQEAEQLLKTAGKDIEAAFHKRMLAYVREDGTVLSHPGCYNEGGT